MFQNNNPSFIQKISTFTQLYILCCCLIMRDTITLNVCSSWTVPKCHNVWRQQPQWQRPRRLVGGGGGAHFVMKPWILFSIQNPRLAKNENSFRLSVIKCSCWIPSFLIMFMQSRWIVDTTIMSIVNTNYC